MATYDPTLPDKVKKFISTYCRLSKHPWNGKPLQLLKYQSDIIEGLYGWHNEDGRLKHKIASVWVPKKNGKSSFCAALALFNLLWKPGNEVYIIAPTIKQAGMIYEEAAAMVDQDKSMSKRLWTRRNLKRIEDKDKFSKLEVLSASPEISGFNAGLLLFDEFAELASCHAQAVWDRTVNACDAREDGHKIIISTAQFDKEHLGYHQYRLAKQTLTKEIDRPDILPIIYEVAEHEDWRNPEQWRKANPAADVLWPFSTIEEDFKTIESSPIDEARFRTLRLNQWVGHTDQWIASDVWAACGQDLDEQDFHNRPAYIGIDYARRYDLCAYSILVPVDDLLYVFPRFFIPHDMGEKKQKLDNVPYLRLWKDDPQCNLHLTHGDVVDPAYMRDQIKIDAEHWDIRAIGFDPWGMEETRQILEADGLPMVEVTQSPSIMAPAVAQFERLVIQKKLIHPKNPVLTWNLGNCAVRQLGATDQIMLDKRRSTARIDGIVSICIALTRHLAAEDYYDAPVLWL